MTRAPKEAHTAVKAVARRAEQTHLEQGAALALRRQLVHHRLRLGRGLGQLGHGLGGLALQNGRARERGQS